MPKSKAEAAKRVLALNLNEVYEPASVIAPCAGAVSAEVRRATWTVVNVGFPSVIKTTELDEVLDTQKQWKAMIGKGQLRCESLFPLFVVLAQSVVRLRQHTQPPDDVREPCARDHQI